VGLWLGEDHHDVFLAPERHGIEIGELWEQRLYEELRKADAMVCVVTASYLLSDWCRAEVGAAKTREILLLPLYAQPDICDRLLAGIQHIDLASDPESARHALTEKLRRLDPPYPYIGLRPFEKNDHRVFFGRDIDAEQLVKQLRSSAERATHDVLLIVGPSGCGKSSLVRAGLASKMDTEPGWCTVPPMRPGADPVEDLARVLAEATKLVGLDRTMKWVRQQLEENRLDKPADDLLVATGAQRLMLVVDQFDELITQTDPTTRTRFATLLTSAPADRVRVVGTLRAEFLAQLLNDATLATLKIKTYLLRALSTWP
jgi:TIR domain/AAA ATPase domain